MAKNNGSGRRAYGVVLAGLVVGSLLSRTALGQEPGPVTIEVGSCLEIESPEARLACFEAQVDAARQDPKPDPAARSPEPARGATVERDRSRSRRDEREREPAPPDVVAKVTALRETVPNAYLITLDNGQVWRQTQPLWYPLRLGSDVRIYSSRWDAFRLTNPQLRGFIQVERVR